MMTFASGREMSGSEVRSSPKVRKSGRPEDGVAGEDSCLLLLFQLSDFRSSGLPDLLIKSAILYR